MRSPLAAWRQGVRWPLAAIGVLVALVIAIGICEAIGWPFLVGPVQKQLAKTLDRRVVFGDDPNTSSGVRIGLIGSVRVRASVIEIGAPPWSSEPRMLLARDAYLKLGYTHLWRAWRGETLHVKELEAAELESRLERLADGRASWQFGKERPAEDEAKEASLPTFGRLRVGDGHIVYRDAVMPAKVDALISLSDSSDTASVSVPASAASGITIFAGGAASGASAAASRKFEPVTSGLRVSATGTYRELPVRVELATAGVLGLLASGAEARAQPLALRATIGRADIAFDGSTTDPLHFAGLKGSFSIAGPSLAAVGDPLGITLPTTPAFKTQGRIAKDGKLWNAVFESASIGTSRLNGAFTYDTRPKVPLLSGRLGGSRLVLADLGPAVGAPARTGGGEVAKGEANAAPGRVIPDKRFDLPALRAMDANIVIDIAVFDPGTDIIEPLKPARAHLLLADGVLTIADFEGTTAQGQLLGYLQLDGRGKEALWTADMRLRSVNLERWLRLKRSGNAPPYLSGKLDALVKVKGSGRSTAEILGSLNGDIRFHMRDAAISHLAVEAGGLDIAQALGMLFKGDDALPILCNLADLDVVKGVARPKVFVMNTRDSTIWIDGNVSLRDETLDLRAVVSPKDFSPLTLRTPVHVRGWLGKPAVSVEMNKLVAKGAAAGLLALLNPLAAIIPFIDPGAKDEAKKADNECAALVRTSGVIPKAVRAPQTTKVPAAALSGASAPRR